MQIGAQLYTLRDYCKTPEDFDSTLAKVAAIGYKTVQISAVGDFGAEKIRSIADKHNLKIILTHTNPMKIRDNTEDVINDHKVMGARYVGIGSIPGEYNGSADNVRKFIADFTPAAKKLRDAGMILMYHNHSFEFEKFDGMSIFDLLIDGFEKDLLGFTVDVYWIQHGGGDPAAWLRKLNGRVDTIHYKDMRIVKNQQRMAEVMEGNLNWDEIIKASNESGVKWAFVEQDDCYGDNPFDCLKTSFDNLRNAGLC